MLLLPLEEATKEPLRPITVPQLDFSCLSPYNEEVRLRVVVDCLLTWGLFSHAASVVAAGCNHRKRNLRRTTRSIK